jgi:hypothetical protein
VSEPENGTVRFVVRRRRTRIHRRHRIIRRMLLLAVMALCVAVTSTVAFRYFAPSLFQLWHRSSSSLDRSALSRDRLLALDQVLQAAEQNRPVYPYSVIPGGIGSVKELKWAAERDPIIAAHYAGFDFDRARVVEVALARTAYVSYRSGNHIYWMRRKITLHKGEKLITDGHLTARGRCANRVEEKPQQGASPAEPSPEALDLPLPGGTAIKSPAFPFESALANPPQPTEPLGLYTPLGGGVFVPIFPPAIPVGVCAPIKKGSGAAADDVAFASGKKKTGPCGSSGPSTIPEPSTWLLLISGLAAIYWQARRKFAGA